MESFPLSIVIEYRATYSSTFKPSATVREICEKALQGVWKESANLSSEWKLTDRHGLFLPPDAKLEVTNVRPHATLYMSKRNGNPRYERKLVKIEDKVEHKV